uniref:Uncharacterized protein n=1 Tax=Anguilla anguilla TaxID=7936 RepID=A0A0E9PLD7_ANGAN
MYMLHYKFNHTENGHMATC